MDPETKKRLIKDTALTLFANKGIDAVSVRDLAAAVGMSASNLYNHYKTVADLVNDLFSEGYAEYGHQLSKLADSEESYVTRIVQIVRLICFLHDTDTVRFRFLLLTQHRGCLENVSREAPENPVAVLHDTVAGAMRSGEIPSGDPAMVTAAVVGILLQCATFRIYGRLDRSMREMSDDIVAMCLRVIRAAPE